MASPLVLIIETGKHKGKQLRLPEGDVTIGRDKEATIRIASSEVSREHARLTVRSDSITVQDLGSRNGTFVNGNPIQKEVSLKPGDLLLIGPMGFRVQDRSLPARKAARDARAKSNPDNALSDDDIAVWLSDDSDSDVGASTGDTTIIKKGRSTQSETPIPPAPKKVFHSVAEEAQDIIRRHLEMLAAREKQAEED